MDYQKEALRKHREWAGKIEIKTRAPLDTAEALALAINPPTITSTGFPEIWV